MFTKDTFFKICIACILVGFALLYWSGLLAPSTWHNWQGMIGSFLSGFGGTGLVWLVISTFKK